MGREATCACTWGDRHGAVKALLESSELIVRGAVSAKVPLVALRRVRVDGELLRFDVDDTAVSLELGARAAASWAAKIAAPAPSVAKKLGLTAAMRVRLLSGADEVLGDALAGTTRVSRGAYDCALARVETLAQLAKLDVAPVWVVYRKGRGGPVGEQAVRDALRARGLIDVKTAAVDEDYTALKFVRRA
ncbi:hypothetical protein WPS_04580 [Vulcanimicrobium alpinum]|uniref:Uncharacterized protein n=1 Tax=Vulcanimicrobium alpinum TaxID=3016050 RepID=A0AAN1XVR5_UNVUL|nr:hypothetical protein [Vulcanimicrobium alpinum]BDE05182.1 hypothetical protein WPS_04580 [Vulcanimicrobium alpinum]